MTRQVALITGGTRGIGLGIARALARDGWNLGLCGLRAREDVTDEIGKLAAQGVEVEYWPADISRPAFLIGSMMDRFGPPNALINNAGRAPGARADLLEATEESFEEVVRTNLQGPYFLTQAVARLMIEAKVPATIVFITSVSAEMASPNRGEYCVSKAGLSMAARLFALSLAPHAIPVYEVRPGIIDTDMTASVKDVYQRRIADGLVPAGYMGQPNAVGETVAALLRGGFSYATGSIINVDGGLSIPEL
jgi:NAD(P)-dependent dehydrogenase (short-subunit alcohol dehydrogenase family)